MRQQVLDAITQGVHKYLSQVSCASPVEVVNAVYAALDTVNGYKPVCSDYDVSIMPADPDEDLIREIHEESRDTIDMVVTMRLLRPLERVIMTVKVENDSLF